MDELFGHLWDAIWNQMVWVLLSFALLLFVGVVTTYAVPWLRSKGLNEAADFLDKQIKIFEAGARKKIPGAPQYGDIPEDLVPAIIAQIKADMKAEAPKLVAKVADTFEEKVVRRVDIEGASANVGKIIDQAKQLGAIAVGALQGGATGAAITERIIDAAGLKDLLAGMHDMIDREPPEPSAKEAGASASAEGA